MNQVPAQCYRDSEMSIASWRGRARKDSMKEVASEVFLSQQNFIDSVFWIVRVILLNTAWELGKMLLLGEQRLGHLRDQHSLKVVGPWEDLTGGRVWTFGWTTHYLDFPSTQGTLRVTVLAQDRIPACFLWGVMEWPPAQCLFPVRPELHQSFAWPHVHLCILSAQFCDQQLSFNPTLNSGVPRQRPVSRESETHLTKCGR